MLDDAVLIAETELLALRILRRALALTRTSERRRAERLSALLSDSAGRDFLLDLTDQVLRIRDPRRAAHRLRDLTKTSLPRSLSLLDRFGLTVLGRIAPVAPRTAERAVDWRIDRDISGVILPADDPDFADYVASARKAGFHLNINVLGEAILGDDEADARCAKVIDRITRSDVDYVSVKISALCANLDILAEGDSLLRVANRLRQVYRAAAQSNPQTFVNLDMEEYRDLELSLRAFMSVLNEPEFDHLDAGIALQAYIPDSHPALARVCLWANNRHARTGADIKVRLVKGANLAMERVDAELHGWPLATFRTKLDVDASYKLMLETALAAGASGGVRIGVASHNLFEISWALTLAAHLGALDRLDIEMLEGMAPPQARAVREVFGSLLLYAPIVDAAERDASIAYLSRRLDENSSTDNFLRSLFDITPASPAWDHEADRFRKSVAARHELTTSTFRTQDRRRAPASTDELVFRNTPDTDFTTEANREWIAGELSLPRAVVSKEVETIAEVDAIVRRALVGQHSWSKSTWDERREVLRRVANLMEVERGRTLALMAATARKSVGEGDPEISEAVDFARYAAHLTHVHERLVAEGLAWSPHAVVVVAGPWNFPYAIPANGLVHALAAGGSAILKPAPETREVGALLVDQLIRAGVPEGVVQLACTPDNEIGLRLVTHPAVDHVVLTGSSETASMFMKWRPDLSLQAETSGKNAILITAAADLDQAIRDLVRSAFGHAGQKCSAASLAIVEASVYDDPGLANRLADAVRSLRVGDPRELATRVAPLIGPPSPTLARALTVLDEGETWLVEPHRVDGSADLWTPGVRMGVAPGSWFHLTECFGPVLGVIRATSLDDAIVIQNMPRFGLTGGLQSLDPAEIERWLDRVEVGNAYVNRHITGAIVQRQPFGGWKASSLGAGHKPGGPNHLHDYGTWTDEAPSRVGVTSSFHDAWRSHFSLANDPSALKSEINVLRYRPLSQVILLGASDTDIETALAASAITGVPLMIADEEASVFDPPPSRTSAPFVRVRATQGVSLEFLSRARDLGVVVDRAPLTGTGLVELPHWLLEQSVSRTMHRHGRLLAR